MTLTTPAEPGGPGGGLGGQAVLLTGVTGFLGRHILWDLLRRSDATQVYCVLRAESPAVAEQRLRALLAAAVGSLPAAATTRCHAVVGDVTEPQLVADPAVRARLLGAVDRVVHCAASVKFNLPLRDARRINVEGTRHVLGFAEELQRRGQLRRIDYFSTAFVAGTASGVVHEADLDATGFHNTYEQTKWEAERLVRQRHATLPITIFRPSIIVGDSRTGYTSNFRVLYWPLKVLASGLVIVVPADRRGIVDVVPIDYVVNAFATLSATPQSLGKCYHLVAGPGRQSSCGELLEMGCEYFGVRAPFMIPPRLSYRVVRPVLYSLIWGKRRALLRAGEAYFPYFAYRASFDSARARAELRGTGLEAPPVTAYFRTVMRFCVDTDWGRKPPVGDQLVRSS